MSKKKSSKPLFKKEKLMKKGCPKINIDCFNEQINEERLNIFKSLYYVKQDLNKKSLQKMTDINFNFKDSKKMIKNCRFKKIQKGGK